MYLFDTDVLSHLAKKRRPKSLMTRLARTPLASQFTSAVNAAEIYHGIFRMTDRDGLQDGLLRFFDERVFPRVSILPFDTDCAPVYGRIKAALERKGRPRFEPDLQIAAIALAHRLTVVTGNVRHFAGIPGLRVENWFAP
jgi:predicted nucleic acid-binding protein